MSLIIRGQYNTALEEINKLENLTQGAIGRQFTRNRIWQDIIAAEVHLGQRNYDEAVRLVKRALIGSHDISSQYSIAKITDIHRRILKSCYRNQHDIRELGEMLEQDDY